MKKVQAQNQKTLDAIDKLKTREEAAETELQKTEACFEKALAGYAMGEITDGELKATRAEISLLKRELQEIPLTIKGLEKRQAELEPQLKAEQKACLKKDAEQQFDRLKKEIEEKGYTRERYGQLKTFAHHLHRNAEVEDLLERARETWENLPPNERSQVLPKIEADLKNENIQDRHC